MSEGPWLCRIASLDRAQLPPNARAQVSGNIAGLCTWTRAMCTYFELAKVVEPKRIAVAIAEARQARNLLSARLHARNREALVRHVCGRHGRRMLCGCCTRHSRT